MNEVNDILVDVELEIEDFSDSLLEFEESEIEELLEIEIKFQGG